MPPLRMLKDPTRRLTRGTRYLSANKAAVSRQRDAVRPDRAWYKTANWHRMRWKVLVRDDFTCRMCGWEHSLASVARMLKGIGKPEMIKGRAPELVADHIDPHRGDEAKFWDEANLQCLCKPCHDGAKQRAERQGG